MSIGEAIQGYRKENNLTQRELSIMLPIDRTVLSKVESGNKQCPPSIETILSGYSWKLALKIADERTGGYISNLLEDVPNLDLHPAALKDLLQKDLEELETALEALVVAKHMDPEKRKQSAEKVWNEMRDVVEKAIILQGVIEEEFGLDRKQLIALHEHEVKRGER